jgi:hypothetical protein
MNKYIKAAFLAALSIWGTATSVAMDVQESQSKTEQKDERLKAIDVVAFIGVILMVSGFVIVGYGTKKHIDSSILFCDALSQSIVERSGQSLLGLLKNQKFPSDVIELIQNELKILWQW